jgi:hypothetical protein
MFKHFKPLLFSSLGVGLLMVNPIVPLKSTGAVYATNIDAENHGDNSMAKLSMIPKDKATVGVIPYYIQNNTVYLLLARERIDGAKKERAGKFSDFGGSVELDGTTFIQNAIRELKEESMGKINIREDALLKQGNVISKLSAKKREIYYIFYPMSEAEYKDTKQLNALWPKLCANKPESSECEKDQYLWLNAEDIRKQNQQVHDIDGNLHTVTLREFFVQDCISNPDFVNLIDQLQARKTSAVKMTNMV